MLRDWRSELLSGFWQAVDMLVGKFSAFPHVSTLIWYV